MEKLTTKKSLKKETNSIIKTFPIKSCVFKPKSTLIYEPFILVPVVDFVRFDKTNVAKNFPNGLSTEGNEITFIGKSRTLLKSSNRVTDQIGSFKRSTRKLEICFSNKVFNIDTFSILGFKNTNSFYWHSINDTISKMPDNCLKLGVETLNQRILYIGRANFTKNINLIGHLAGNIEQQLIVPIENQMVQFKKFEILCLRPSPCSLKNLCRVLIRKLMRNDNLRIEKLRFLIPDNLIKFIKFSSELKINQQLKCGESLTSSNGKYSLYLDYNGRLIYYINENRDYLFLYDNVESLWFSDLKLMTCFRNFTSVSFLTNLDNLNILLDNSKFKIFDDGCLKIISPHHKKIIVFQFRDDLYSFWNLTTPKFDFVYYFEDKSNKSVEINEDSSSDSSESDSDSDSDSSSSTDGLNE